MTNEFDRYDFLPRWLDIEAACRYCSRSKNNLLKKISEGEIYGTKRDGKWSIDRLSIDAYFEKDRMKVREVVSRLLHVV